MDDIRVQLSSEVSAVELKLSDKFARLQIAKQSHKFDEGTNKLKVALVEAPKEDGDVKILFTSLYEARSIRGV